MILQGVCKKCNHPVRLDVGSRNKQEIIEQLKQLQSFNCPGHHAEMCSPFPDYWNVQHWELTEKRVSWASAYPDHDFGESLDYDEKDPGHILLRFRPKQHGPKAHTVNTAQSSSATLAQKHADSRTHA